MKTDADGNHSQNSAYFWFDNALIGDVYTALRPLLKAWRMAMSATAVLPEPVGAIANKSMSCFTMTAKDLFWKSSIG